MALISPKNKFVFIHIPKTGGTSVIQALHQSIENEIEFNRKIDHMSQIEVKEFFPYDFTDYTFFAIVRHPLHMLYSFYCYKRGNTQNLSALCDSVTFEEFVEFWSKNHFNERILDEGQHAFVEKDTIVFKLENMNKDIPRFFKEKFGIDIVLQHFNKSKKTKEIFTEKVRQLVYQKYKQDYEMFNYDP